MRLRFSAFILKTGGQTESESFFFLGGKDRREFRGKRKKPLSKIRMQRQ